MRRWRALAVTVVSACLVFSGCGGADPNAQDRSFVAGMVPHHHLGMELLDMAARRVVDTRVRRLVFEMGSYHQSELEQLHSWAIEWRVASSTDFPGRIDNDRLGGLAALAGTDYDRAWLELMIEHHEGAIEIAERQMSAGSNGKAIEMAQSVHEIQTNDIAEMTALLGSLAANG